MTRVQSLYKLLNKEYLTKEDIYTIGRYVNLIDKSKLNEVYKRIDNAIAWFELLEAYEICDELLKIKLESIELV